MTTTVRPTSADMDARIRARRQAVIQAQRRRRRRRTLGVILILCLAAVAFAASRSPLFAISDVQVVGVGQDRAREVLAAATVNVGENLLDANLSAAGGRVEALPWVSAAEVSRVPPSTVRISVTPRVPVATVNTTDASWMVDASGVVVAGGSGDELDRIDAVNAVLPGPGVQISDAAVRNALAVLAALPEDLAAQIVRYDAPSVRDLRLLLRSDAAPNGVWVRFGVAERIEAKVHVLRALLEQAGAHLAGDESSGVAELDVRAPDNPVLIPPTG